MILYYVTLMLAGIASAAGFFIRNKRNQALSTRKAVLLYLGFGVLLSLGGFIGYAPAASHAMRFFILLQLVAFGLGLVAYYAYQRNAQPAADSAQPDWNGVLFILANAVAGMAGFAVLYHYFSPDGVTLYYALCLVPFVLPGFLNTAFKSFQAIPQDIFKVWYYPIHAPEVIFDTIDTSVIYMLELEYSKTLNDPRLTNTKQRAPVAMNFGDWFRSYIEYHNQKYDADPIHYRTRDGEGQGWVFYVKPSLLGSPKYIDPEQTIAQNGISEKGVIVARRVGLVAEPSAAFA